MLWIEEFVGIAEASGSSSVYSILKLPDEKHVTEQAYNNPVFVEYIVRNVAEKLQKDERITQFTVTAENHESNHNHNAYAVVSWNRTEPLETPEEIIKANSRNLADQRMFKACG